MTLFIITSLNASQLLAFVAVSFSLLFEPPCSLIVDDDCDVTLLVLLLALSIVDVVVLSLKLLFTFFDEILLVLLTAFVFASLPELLLDSLSSTEN